MSYETELAFAKDLAYESGEIMKRYFRAEDIGTEWKEDNTPLTQADTTINKLVIERAKKAFPDYGLLGEEQSYHPERDIIWVLDPIDGTVPFSLGIPIFTFSLALVKRTDGQPVIAVTYDPFLDEIFWAVKGEGAFMNGQPIKTSHKTSLEQAYMHMGALDVIAEDIDYSAAKGFELIRNQGAKVLSIPSGIYTSNRVATGQFTGAIIGHPKAWDVAASALLVEEAGGVVTNLRGERRRFDEDGAGAILAANPTIHKILMEVVHSQK